MPSRRSGSKGCSATGNLSQKGSYQYDINSCMMIMSIPPTWHKRDLNANIHDENMSIPSTFNKGMSKHNMMNHDNKYITQMIPHHIKQCWLSGV